MNRHVLLLTVMFVVLPATPVVRAQKNTNSKLDAAILRAVEYLSIEVRDWSRRNGCFSCHNNGIAAVALLAAKHKGYDVRDDALEETIEWLKHPGEWDNNRGDPAVSDKKLARFHFALARTEAVATGLIDRGPSDAELVNMLAADQSKSGVWVLAPEQAVGSPITLGDAFATTLAITMLVRGTGKAQRSDIAKALDWVSQARTANTLDRGSKLIGLSAIPTIRRLLGESAGALPRSETASGEPAELVEALIATQNKDGGWGPYRNAPSEVFDTCVGLMGVALAGDVSNACEGQHCARAVERAMDYILSSQLSAGGWPATTRPSGGDSYAQHIATSAWALYTLIAAM